MQLHFQALIMIFQYACFRLAVDFRLCENKMWETFLIPTSIIENAENNFFQIRTAPLAKIKVFLEYYE